MFFQQLVSLNTYSKLIIKIAADASVEETSVAMFLGPEKIMSTKDGICEPGREPLSRIWDDGEAETYPDHPQDFRPGRYSQHPCHQGDCDNDTGKKQKFYKSKMQSAAGTT